MSQDSEEQAANSSGTTDTDLVEVLTEQLIGNQPVLLDRTDFSDEDL